MVPVPAIAAWPSSPLEGRMVLVTGAGNGIGRGLDNLGADGFKRLLAEG